MSELNHSSEDLHRILWQDGYVHLKECINSNYINMAVRAINHELGQGMSAVDTEKMRINAKSFGSKKLLQSKAIQNLFYETCAIELVEQLYGKENMLLSEITVQVALRFPQDVDDNIVRYPPWHLDNIFPEGLRGFGLIVGIFLNDTADVDSGNFTVFPGGHLILEEHFRKIGCLNSLYRDKNGRIILPAVDVGNQHQILAKAGDIAICHHQLPHRAAPNISSNIRMAVFFRVYHKDLLSDHPLDCKLRELALTNLWSIGWNGMKNVQRDDSILIDVDVPSFCDCAEKLTPLDIGIISTNPTLSSQWIQGNKCSDTFEYWNSSISFVADLIKGHGTFLDVGCANGFFLACLCHQIEKKNMSIIPYGIESDSSIFKCKRLFPELFHIGHFIQTDLSIFFESIQNGASAFPSVFDFISLNLWTNCKLEHELDKHCLTKICDLLVPGSTLLLRLNATKEGNKKTSEIVKDMIMSIFMNSGKSNIRTSEEQNFLVFSLQ